MNQKQRRRLKAKATPVAREDNWQSLLGAFGDRRDRGRTDTVRFVAGPQLLDDELSDAYENLWLARRIVDAPVEDALRNGWGVEDDKLVKDFERINYTIHPEGAFQRACAMARLKGGAALFKGYRNSRGQQLTEPPPPGAEIEWLEVFDRYQLIGEDRVQGPENYDRADYDRPQRWRVMGDRRTGMVFHPDRAIFFPGAPRARSTGVSKIDQDWGLSILQAIWADVQRYGVFWQAVAHLMQLASVGVLKIEGLLQMLARDNKDAAEARIDILNEMLSLTRMLMLDSKYNESYHREAVSFADMPHLLQEVQIATAGAAGMPVTKLFGRAPAGMNATGESDTRNWYDRVQDYSERVIQPMLEKLFGDMTGREVEVEFESLWQPTDLEKAQVRAEELKGDAALYQMGLFSEDELRESRQNDARPEDHIKGGKAPEPEPLPEALDGAAQTTEEFETDPDDESDGPS